MLLLIVAGAALLTACVPMAMGPDHHRGMHGGGDDTRSDAQVRASGDTEIEIRDFAFRPGNVQVEAGASVTWTNSDPVPHTATALDREWDTGVLAEGDSGSIRFDEPGIYEYRCLPHPDMKARIEVVPRQGS
ncbi:MAG: cupredoxin family copper-binding protein [Dehalococcoidia bacterium]